MSLNNKKRQLSSGTSSRSRKTPISSGIKQGFYSFVEKQDILKESFGKGYRRKHEEKEYDEAISSLKSKEIQSKDLSSRNSIRRKINYLEQSKNK